MTINGFDDNLLDAYLGHYGTKYHSGRYPYGSGEDPYQHDPGQFLSRVRDLRKSNLIFYDENGKKHTGDSAVALSMNMTMNELRNRIGNAEDDVRRRVVTEISMLNKQGLTKTEIGRRLGISDSSVHSYLNAESMARMDQARETADMLRDRMKQTNGKFIDIGGGKEHELGVTKKRLDKAVQILIDEEGYNVYPASIPQVTNPGKQTNIKLLCPPGTQKKDAYDISRFDTMDDVISRDNGKTLEKKFHYPQSISSKRVNICYAEEGGIKKDGLVELRRGVDDLSLGNSRYSQVRILVDGTHYIKGMAVYSDDLPPGVDIRFNTNKHKGTPMCGDAKSGTVLKEIKKDDPDNPFGSAIKDANQGGQYWYTGKDGKEHLGAINKRADEGDWDSWKDKIPSQFLSKQSLELAKRQLKQSIDEKQAEFDSIKSVNNSVIKKQLLQSFADDCDSQAVHLKAAALPGQKYHVIIPIPELKDNEIYAPKYENGTKLALVRYPHGGTFEIPVCTVNNKHPKAKNVLGQALDAVGINDKVASRLSGADFDGDTVMTIPITDKIKISHSKPLAGLENFEPKDEYCTKLGNDGKYYNKLGAPVKIMSKTLEQKKMGEISNLISDMTLRGATDDEKCRAVKHSMVVIDARKHKLDYKSSYEENKIKELEDKYQGHIKPSGRYGAGASTIISRAKGQDSRLKTQGTPNINQKGKPWYDPSKPEGALIYKLADDLYYPDRRNYDPATGLIEIKTTTKGKSIVYNTKDKAQNEKYKPKTVVDPDTGKVRIFSNDGTLEYRVKTRTQKTTRMDLTDDARTLVSGYKKGANPSTYGEPMEHVYANFANTMKQMAIDARKELVYTPNLQKNSEAAKKYSAEVASLQAKYLESQKNRPKERMAQAIATRVIQAKVDGHDGEFDGEELRKMKDRELKIARERVGAKRTPIEINDKEWEAIQAGAISKTELEKIVKNSDIDKLREKATPRETVALSPATISKMNMMYARGDTYAEIASKLGVSVSTVIRKVNKKGE